MDYAEANRHFKYDPGTRITKNMKLINIGWYATAEEASQAYQEAARCR